MDDGNFLSIAIIILLLLCAMYFAAAETAFSSVSRSKLRARAEKGDHRAKKALWITENFDRAITTLLIGTNIVHLTVAAIVTVLVSHRWGMDKVPWGTVATTLVVFFAGEMLPKSVAKKYSERISMGTAGSLCFFMRLFAPLSAVLTAIGQGAAKLTKGDAEVTVTENELYDIIEDMTDAGNLDEGQGELVQSALEFGDVTAENVLTARVDLAAVDASWPVEEITRFVRGQRHSRLPVYEGSIDNIIGVLQIRKYIKALLRSDGPLDIRALLDDAYFVPGSTSIAWLLPEMSRKRLNMAVVTDSWGGTLGVVTVEDILEELVGEIWDEEDEVVEYFVPLGGGRYELDAGLDVGEAFALLGFEDPEDDEQIVHLTLAEWALEQFEFMPRQKDRFTYHGLEFVISDIYRHRIRKLTARRLPEEGGGTQ